DRHSEITRPAPVDLFTSSEEKSRDVRPLGFSQVCCFREAELFFASTPPSPVGRLPPMLQQVRRYRWRLPGAGLLLCLGVGAWCGSRWLAAETGSAEDVFARIRVGMSQEEAVAVLRTYNPDIIDGVYARGKTRRGVSWSGTNLVGETIADLPPPQEVEQ